MTTMQFPDPGPGRNEERQRIRARWACIAASGLLVVTSLLVLAAWKERWLDRDAGEPAAWGLVGGLALMAAATCRRWRERAAIAVLASIVLVTIPPAMRDLELRWHGVPLVAELRANLVGRPMPDFSCSTVDGRPFRFSELRGKVVGLEIWRTWCPPCLENLPYLAHAQEVLADDGVVVLAVSSEPADVQRQVRDALKLPITMLVADSDAPRILESATFPFSLIVDRDGRIASVNDLRGYYGVTRLAAVARGAPWRGDRRPPPPEAPSE